MTGIRNAIKELFRYPSAVLGLIIILGLVILSIYAVIKIPYSEALVLWRGGEGVWDDSPKTAAPAWINFFRKDKLPASMVLSSQDGTAPKTVTPDKNGNPEYFITYTIDYPYAYFPEDMKLFLTTEYTAKQPYISLTWTTPDGRDIRVADFASGESQTYSFSQDTKLERRLGGLPGQKGLFVADPQAGATTPLQGQYQLHLDALTFEPDSNVDAKFVLYGSVYGVAGTDHLRRDLSVALLWGTPVALAFGLLAALGTTITTLLIAAFGVWFGGWVDGVIQRVTEVNLVLPFLPILIMVGTFYSHSIWLMLGVTILLSIFGATIKTYRAVFLQVKESPYIEAAQAYGAGNWRIIFSYLTPRIIPFLIPQLVTLVPTFVFLEASLAVLGLGDPVLPTWGKIINDAEQNGALYLGYYYWVLEPAALLMVSGLAFALLGFSLDRVFNPRLRGL
jgi:peptide/nickel transport system permease protein